MRFRYGDVFRFQRLLRIFFYTSNADKLIQARLIFMRSGYQLTHYRSQHEPYDEDYSLDTQGLLTQALKQVSQEFERRSVLFVEDTSLRIEAVSGTTDYPGTRVKEWFSETSFAELDRQIALRGGDRRCTVKSDIALRLPTLSRPVFFHGETSGYVAEAPPAFTTSPQYPWLTPDTFNGWFVPEGTNRRLGEMEFEESLPYDFRAKSLTLLIERLEELNAVINLGRWNHVVRQAADAEREVGSQLSLLPLDRREVLIVIGHKCAGKSTFSDFLMGQRTGVFALEGSTLLRQIAEEEGITISNSADAMAFLEKRGWDIVAKRAADYIARENADINIVTGMRTVEEVLWLRSKLPAARVVLIEADPRTRFERHVKRARSDDAQTFKEFTRLDEEQMRFGALRVAHEIADVVVRNDSDLRSYFRRIDELVSTIDTLPDGRQSPSELHRSLRALRKIGRAATCDEIAAVTAEQGFAVRKYNNNRALKSVPEFATRLEKRGDLLRYRLSPRAPALLRLLDLIAMPASTETVVAYASE
ncbi:non-canonical purine NTP pyrophosphatase [Chelativorans sp. M5D2P16]|uniref:non-canonical purine NTP pyrophosphatase n=1 Tax=Chelativorans sp. M5D2P16 TaxID=3095678 RepID=UPI002ACA7E74|nr:non-canonical purine NTP pyrophosphatase [Chelativorans sp. M5D2P16]MDZ5698698.1 non-canonical purine NTP pyrophosphatase [Chelativorans sp. M5D2P16]